MKNLFLMILLLAGIDLSAQDLEKKATEIQAEGEALYRSEWASWYGTDIFLAQCKDKAGKQGGYLSYDNGKELVNIFFSNDIKPNVLATTTFPYGFDQKNYHLDTTTRKFTVGEEELYTIRKTAIKQMESDTLFKFYKNANLNPIPFIYKGIKKVYVLTGPTVNGVVLFGNDYQITFNKKNELTSTSKLHNSLIVIKTKLDSGKVMLSAIHTHVKGKDEFITPTDICTLLLYKQFTSWTQHIVISEKYVSLWDYSKNKLVILTGEAWKKMSSSVLQNSLPKN